MGKLRDDKPPEGTKIIPKKVSQDILDKYGYDAVLIIGIKKVNKCDWIYTTGVFHRGFKKILSQLRGKIEDLWKVGW